ncbi:DUF4097 family beta strand repeat-containing protein [Streptomyces yaizuensis]|uniref:DUF4097 family beta strand repeat-containing protein n=1 Tax=Streptomyces yaizuensis TaxID=2989713 RepID=A0ABQ5P9B8_9ACTN|nr:DUF4097 family beta strand repeat-containing protein [Streptomyces sp. YSPA8]GLF99161.1 DUF4097 family beta strand repeat-containing protein [Streptomyces sp. YSPA8]
MAVFETPRPLVVSIDLAVGDVRIAAGERTETTVEVRPRDPGSEADTAAAGATRVDCSGGRLTVRGPKPLALFGRVGEVEVVIGLPADSEISAAAQAGGFRATGRLGQCRLRTANGDIRLAVTGPLVAASSFGDVTVDRVDGPAEVSAGAGAVRIGELRGTGTVRNANGDTWVGEVSGRLQVRANGSISVDKAYTTLEAKTARGDIRVGEAVSGSVTLATSRGRVDIGIGVGTAARLDVRTKSGEVHNFLTAADGPGESRATAEIHAATAHGDIVIRRA